MIIEKVGIPNIHNYRIKNIDVSNFISGDCRAIGVIDNYNKIELGDFFIIEDDRKQNVVRVASHIQEFENGFRIVSVRKLTESETGKFNERD